MTLKCGRRFAALSARFVEAVYCWSATRRYSSSSLLNIVMFPLSRIAQKGLYMCYDEMSTYDYWLRWMDHYTAAGEGGFDGAVTPRAAASSNHPSGGFDGEFPAERLWLSECGDIGVAVFIGHRIVYVT